MVARQLLVAGVAAGLVLAAPLHASTIRVPADQPTLQQGIDAAAIGDTVLVAPGTYSGPSNQNLDFHGKDLVFRSAAGPQTTIIDCAGTGDRRGFHIRSGETAAAVIEGFKVRHAYVSGGLGNEGAGIRCDSASPTIRNCILEDNTSDWSGAGIALFNSSSALVNCIINSNTATHNGGGLVSQDGAITLIGCTISNNEAGGDFGYGGGISAGGSLTAVDCEISNNAVYSSGDDSYTQSAGGGMSAGGEIHLTRCTFTGNLASAANDNTHVGNRAWGGGASLSGNVVLNACVFRNNRVVALSGPFSTGGNQAEGGALSCQGVTMSDCVFSGNSAQSEGNPDGNHATGGAVVGGDLLLIGCLFDGNSASAAAEPPIIRQGHGGGVATEARMHLIGCTLVNNAASTSGAAVHVRAGGTATIENSILAFSTAAEAVSCAGGTSAFLLCTDLYGNAGGDWVGCIAGQEGAGGNFSADPLFCQPSSGNYRIDADSPCAPAGSPGQCGLIGALPIGCGMVGIASDRTPAPISTLRIVPNPVRPDGRLLWTSAVSGPLNLRLYDVLGRLVLERDLGGVAAGAHELPWSDVVGNDALRSGIYFLTLERNGTTMSATRVVVTR